MLVRALGRRRPRPHGRASPRSRPPPIGLGIVEQAIVFDTGRDLYVFPVLFAIIVVAGRLLEPHGPAAAGSTTTSVSTWQAAREVRPIPTELRRSPEVRAVALRRVRRRSLVDRVRPDAAALALGRASCDRHGHRDRRHRRGLAGAAHRLGGPREPRSDGVRRRSVGRSAAWVTQTRQLGPRARAPGRRGWLGALVAVVVGHPGGPRRRAHAGRHHPRARAGHPLLAAQPRVLRLGARGAASTTDPTLFGRIPIESEQSSTSSRSASSPSPSRLPTGSDAAGPAGC